MICAEIFNSVPRRGNKSRSAADYMPRQKKNIKPMSGKEMTAKLRIAAAVTANKGNK